VVKSVTSMKKIIRVLKLLSKNRFGLTRAVINRHIVQSIAKAKKRLPREASGDIPGNAAKLMR
jgi:hypothetical protein